MKNFEEITSELVGMAKDVYFQGIEDGKNNSPAFEDGFSYDARAQIGEILDELGVDAERLAEIIQAEREGRCLILTTETAKTTVIERAMLHVSRQLAIKRQLVKDYETAGDFEIKPVTIALRREMERVEVTLAALCEKYEREGEVTDNGR